MQTIAHTPAHAQHVPDGWSFPTLTPHQPPQPNQPVHPPVSGGGGEPVLVARLRWGRIVPVLAGITLLVFGAWNMSNDAPTSKQRSAGGNSSSSELEVAPSTSEDSADDAMGATDGASSDLESTPGTGATGSSDSVTTPPAATVQPPVAAPARQARPRGAGVRRAGGVRRGNRARAVAGATAMAAASANAAGANAAAGGGAAAGSPNGQLPMTGIETWIAAFLGVLLLAGGICIHVNAVRLGMTALLYRRGLLLRPVDCARLAQEHGFSRARVLLSDMLHRLLEEPRAGGEFVSARFG